MSFQFTLHQALVWDYSYGRLDQLYFKFQLGMTAHSCFKGHITYAIVQQALILLEVTFVQLVYSPKQICSGLLLLAMRSVIHRKAVLTPPTGPTQP